MSFGLPHRPQETKLTYGGYLRVPELLGLQTLQSDPGQHDETLFIIIHQVYELWFKQMLHEVDTILECLDRNEALAALRLVRRCIEIQRVLIAQIAVLETMTPMDFLAFRDHLLPASGFQSCQFRELEFTSGLKNERYLRNFPPETPEYQRLQGRLAGPTLGQAFDTLLQRRGFPMPADADSTTHAQRLASLVRLYQEADKHYDLFLLAESLIEYDEAFALWRLHHVKMVERMIGTKPGTGGSTGAAYLKSTVEHKFFPDLWEVRGLLSKNADAYSGRT
jgi:tryptophan 2,3-dioxygenase